MVHVGEHLVVRIRVDRRHNAVLHSDRLVQRLDQRSQAVGRARCIGNDRVGGGQRVVVHAVHDRLVHPGAARRRDHNLLGATVDVLAGRFSRAKQPRALEDHVDAELSPRQLGGVAFGEDLHAIAVDDDVAAVDFDRAVELAVSRVVARKVGIRLRVAEVIQCDDVELVSASILVDGTHDVASDAPVAVDADLYCHFSVSKFPKQNSQARTSFAAATTFPTVNP